MSSVILLSGGMDSAYLARAFAVNAAFCLFVDYGQPSAEREAEAARSICSGTGIPLIERTISGLSLGEMTDASGVTGPRIVPARNALLCSLAANLATGKADEVLIGCTMDDDQYPDCGLWFLDRISDALHASCGVKVVAPLARRRKLDVLKDCRDAQLMLWDSWSCYGPGPMPCGTCNSCVTRTRAVNAAGILDPLMGSRAR